MDKMDDGGREREREIRVAYKKKAGAHERAPRRFEVFPIPVTRIRAR